MALRALLLASQLSTSDVLGTVHVVLNGKPVGTIQLTKENNDLFYQWVFKTFTQARHPPFSSALKARTGSPTRSSAATSRHGRRGLSLNLSLSISPTTAAGLAQNDIAAATANIRNNQPKTVEMVMVDRGIQPGFDLLSEDLQAFQEKTASAPAGRLEKFSLTATQAILYFNALARNQTVTLNFRLRAKYRIRAHTFQSRVYEYYDPDISATASPSKFEITPR